MADPWVEIIRPIWPEVLELLICVWTPQLSKDFNGKLALILQEDLRATHASLLRGENRQTHRNRIGFVESYLVLASVCGESSFDIFLESLRSSSAASKLLGQELERMWQSFQKKDAKRPKRPSRSRWRYSILASELSRDSIKTISARFLMNFAASLSTMSLIAPSDFQQLNAADKARENIDKMFMDVLFQLPEPGMGIFLALLRTDFPQETQAMEKEAGVGIHLRLKHIRMQMERSLALAQLERLSTTDEDKSLVTKLHQRFLEEGAVTKPKRKVNIVREAVKRGKTFEKANADSQGLGKQTGLSPEARQSYDSALQGGERKVPHIRALFCGPGRVGKTCLGRSMLGHKFSIQVDSTIGVELQKIVCTVVRQKKSKTWVWRAEKDEDEQQRLLAKKVLKDEVTERAEAAAADEVINTQQNDATDRLPLDKSGTTGPNSEACLTITERSISSGNLTNNTAKLHLEADIHTANASMIELESGLVPLLHSLTSTDGPAQEGGTPEQGETESRVHYSSESEKKTELQEEAALYVKRFLRDIHQLPAKFEGDLDDDMCFVDLWDFAGQDSFAAVQHMLLSELRCVYAVVFDASLNLEDPAPSTFCMGGAEHPIEGGSILTNFDVIESWLNTIHQAVGDTNAPVYVIGCQIDRITADEREDRKDCIRTYIWKNAEDKAYKNNINAILFVDNTVSGTSDQDPSIAFLRHDLIENMTEQLKMPIPLRWLPFTVAVRRLARTKNMPWLFMEQVSEVAYEVCKADHPGVPLDVKSLLQFHHHLGHVLYYARNQHLNDRVIIDVEWLLKIVSLLFIPQVIQEQEKRFRRHFDLLRKKGVLLESLTEHIWKQHGDRTAKFTQLRDQRNYLFHLMEEFSLLFNTGQVHQIGHTKPSRKFYIPALVSRVEDTLLAKAPSDQSPPIYLFSGTTLLFPQTLFWCLVVRCMKHFQSEEDPVLYRNSARILCRDVFWLVLTYFQHGIKLVVEHEHSLAPLAETASITPDKAVLSQTCHAILSFAEEQLEELKGDTLKHVVIQRAAHCECSLNEHPCKKHRAAACQQTECRHFIKLVEGKVPRCPLGLRPGQDVTAVAQCWLFPKRVQSEAETLSSPAQTNFAVLSEQGEGEATVTAVLESSVVSSSSDEVAGVLFKSLPDVTRTRIFNKIAMEFAGHRKTIISLLIGLQGNKKLDLKRSTTAEGDSEHDLLLDGLGIWLEEADQPSGRELYDALVDSGCPAGLVKKYKKPLQLPESYAGGSDIF